MVDDGDSGWGDDGIAYDSGYSHAETTCDAVGVVQDHVPEAHDSDQINSSEIGFHGLNAYCMVMEVDDCTESGYANRIYASRGIGVVHHSKSWVSSGENVYAVVGEPVNKEKEGTGDSSIGSQVLVFLVHLGSCNV